MEPTIRNPYRDVSLRDSLAIELPVWIWHGFSTAYATTDWANLEADKIAQAIMYALLEPAEIKASEAHHQEEMERSQHPLTAMFESMFPFNMRHDPETGVIHVEKKDDDDDMPGNPR